MNRSDRCVIELSCRGRPWRDSMAVDVVLWFILAAMVAWIFCGCVFTAPGKRQVKLQHRPLEQKFDRAA
jgi:hypothetical protein